MHALDNFVSTSDDSIQSYFNTVCPIFPEYLKCIDNFSEAANSCFDNDGKTLKDAVVRIIRSFGSYACRDNGIRVSNFYKSLPNCIMINNEQFFQCLNVPTIAKFAGATSTEEISFAISIELCTDFKFVEQCFLNSMNKCEHEIAQIAAEMFSLVKSELNCEIFENNSV